MAEKKRISVRVPKPLAKAAEKYIEMDTHMNLSDWLRNAMREKLQNDAPEVLEEEINNG